MNVSNPQCEAYSYAKIYKNIKICSHYPGRPYTMIVPFNSEWSGTLCSNFDCSWNPCFGGGTPDTWRGGISAFVTCWDQCMCRIWHWHFMWTCLQQSGTFAKWDHLWPVNLYNATDMDTILRNSNVYSAQLKM